MKKYTTLFRFWQLCRWLLIFAPIVTAEPAVAAVGKGYQILMQRGLQTQGMVTKDDNFHLTTYQNANYSTINWLWDSNVSLQGPAPGFPWARWVNDENSMPTAAEQPYLSQLVALQLGDEWDLNNSATRDRAVNWFNNIRAQWPNTLLYMNNWGTQIGDTALGDFIARAKPDMLSFDTYPWQSTYVPPAPGEQTGHGGSPIEGPPTGFYQDLRRYRIHASNAGVPLAIYRQTFHAVQDYNQTVYRDPSPSEMNVNTFGALAFGATTFIDFTYNTGASTLFNPPGGDSNPNARYAQQATINQRARNLGKALVRLTGEDNPLNGTLDGGQPTKDIMLLRGRTGPNPTDVAPMPIGFVADPDAPNAYSYWDFGRNDPYLTGWGRTNNGTVNGGLVGDVIFSWFKPLDSSIDDPTIADDQLYMMVVNGLTSSSGTTADCRQTITMDFLKTGTNGAAFPGLVKLNSDTGTVDPLPVTSLSSTKWRLTLALDGGDGVLMKFNTGDPFVGIGNGLAGDFNQDGVVNMLDYVSWRKGLGTTFSQNAYNVWRSHFGQRLAGSGSASDLATAIPEPATLLLVGLSAAIVFLRPRCRRRALAAIGD